MPETICKLEKLTTLDLSNNYLKSLHDNVGNLRRLKILKLRGNKNLQRLPKSICQAQSLILLDLDCDNFVYPPATVAEQGTENIIKYICDGTTVCHFTFTLSINTFFR